MLSLLLCACGSEQSLQSSADAPGPVSADLRADAATGTQSQVSEILVQVGADYDEGAGPLAVVRDDGTGFRWRTRRDAVEARWSPDGRRIAYAAGTNAAPFSSVWVMNANGRNQRRLAPEAFGYTSSLEWSPNGTEILYDRRSGLWSMRADGSRKRRLLRSMPSSSPDWSPDGRSIAFANINKVIHVMGADGKNLRRLANRGTAPRWTADGKTIVFLRTGRGSSGVYAVPAAGGAEHLVAPLLGDEDDGVYVADTSPDRGWLLVGNTPGLTAVSLGDGAVHPLTRASADFGGDWSPDGRRIAFVRGPDLWVMDADGRNPRRVRKSPGWRVFSWAWWKP